MKFINMFKLFSCLKNISFFPFPMFSESHRVFEIGRDHWRFSTPTPLLRLGQTLPAHSYVQSGFKYLQRWRIHNFSCEMVPDPNHPHSRSLFSCSDGILCISNYTHGLLSSHWAPMKRAWLRPLFTLPSRIYKLIRSS